MHLLELSFTLIQETLQVSGQELSRGISPTLLLRETLTLDFVQLRRLTDEVHALLNWQRDLKRQRERLEQLGGMLYDLLLGPHIKGLLRGSQAPHLRLLLPESLLFLPWELLHDGALPLCCRFSMGRVVVLEDVLPLRPEAQSGVPRLLIVYDPQDNLEHAAQEGLALNQKLAPHRERLHIQMLNPPVPRQDLLEQLKGCGMLHFAGHAYAPSSSDPPGWQLEDARLTPEDVARMAGAKHFPALVVANACYSAVCEAQTRSLPGAFLAAGARHYLGNVSELPDVVGQELACSLYEALLSGSTIGDALLAVRRQQRQRTDRPAQAWASQVLYGDPTARYFTEITSPPAKTGAESASENSSMAPPGSLNKQALEQAPQFFPEEFLTPPPVFQPPVPHEQLREKPAPVDVAQGGTRADPTPPKQRPSAVTPERTAQQGTADEAGEASKRRGWSWGRWITRIVGFLLVSGLSLMLTLGQQAGLLTGAELVWEAGRMLFRGAEDRFESDVVLLALKPDPGAVGRRALYAELLERLVQSGASPRIVAFDTWLKPDALEDSDRLIQAVASALPRFPVMFALERSRETGALMPPAPWLLEGVSGVLEARAWAACRASHAGAPEKIEPEDAETLKGCVEQLTQTERSRLILADVQILRPSGLAGYFGLRVPILHRAEGESADLLLERPHFALQLAGVTQARLDPAQRRITFDGVGLSAPYNVRGMMPVVITGRAGFPEGGAFPAWPLEEALAVWAGRASSAVEASAVNAGAVKAGAPPSLRQLAGARVLVGIASDAKSEVIMDRYPTLMGNLYGVEVLANIAESILAGKVPRMSPFPGLFMAMGPLAVLLGMVSVLRGKGRWGVGLGSLLLLLGSYALLLEARIQAPPPAVLLSLWLGGVLGLGLVRLESRWKARAQLPLSTWLLLLGGILLVVPGFGMAQSGKVPFERPAPVPPSAIVPPAVAPGWRLIQTVPRQGDLSSALRLDGQPVPAVNAVFAGGKLEATQAPLEVTLEYRAPARGMLVTQVLQAPFVAELQPNGNLRLEGGSIWTRLYRTLEQAGDVLLMTYDGAPAGFGSTEVLYRREKGVFGSRTALSVIEGHVRVGRPGQEDTLQAGQEAVVRRGRVGRARALSQEAWTSQVEQGNRLMGPAFGVGTCFGQDARIKGAGLVTGACFDSVEAREKAFRAGRSQLVAAAAPSGWLEVGSAWLASGDETRAADAFRRGATQNPSDATRAKLALELGNSRWAAGLTMEARKSYEEAVTADPGLALAWNNLGVMQWRDGELEQARRSLKRATELSPRLLESHRNLGRVLLQEDPKSAAEAWRKAVALAPQDPQLLEELASALVQANELPQAVEVGAALAGVGALSEPLMFELAELYELYGKELWEQGQQQLALEYYERAMELRAKAGRGK